MAGKVKFVRDILINTLTLSLEYILSIGEECMKLNPDLKCSEPHYEFCEYLDEEHRESNVLIRHDEAVTSFGNENDNIKMGE